MGRLDPIATERTGRILCLPALRQAGNRILERSSRTQHTGVPRSCDFPDDQRSATTITGLHQWFKTWKASGDTHHEVLARVPMLVSHPDPAWVNAFFDELAAQQHPTLGTWPAEESTNISRTFAYSLIYTGMDKLPPQPEKIVDAMLHLQEENGFWHGRPNFSTMDAVYLLSRLPKAAGWRETDATAALHRVSRCTHPLLQSARRTRQTGHPSIRGHRTNTRPAIRSIAPAIHNIAPVAIRMEQQGVLAMPRNQRETNRPLLTHENGSSPRYEHWMRPSSQRHSAWRWKQRNTHR